MSGNRCAKVPCKSCPYRKDVPSGIWDASEYDKLPSYDGQIVDQVVAGAARLFDCHQNDGHLCAGWIAAHGADNLLACRLHGDRLHPSVWDYESPVPVFASGKEACDHGKREIKRPGDKAMHVINRLVKRG